MRRALASLLLVLFTSPVIEPLLRAETAPSLPACCRLKGKHHCSLPSAQESSTDPGFKAVQPKCCYYPMAMSVSGQWMIALPSHLQAVHNSVVCDYATLAWAEAGRRVSFSRSRQKRGPPTSLLPS